MRKGYRLTDEQYEEIKQEGINLFVRYDIRRIPISGFVLAEKMGIKVVPYSALSDYEKAAAKAASTDGFYLSDWRNGDCIFYDDEDSKARQNMTVMHEIGHLVLGHTEGMDPEEAEAEAAFFAKYALAPPPLVHEIQPPDCQDIQSVFGLSAEAALYAWEYYQKWRKQYHWEGDYYPYERQLLRKFGNYLEEVTTMM